MNQYPDYLSIPGTTTGGGADLPLTTRGDLVTRDASDDIRLPVGSSGQVLTTDGTDVSWGAVTGTGDVVGPASNATDGNVALFDGTTGKLIKDSLLLAKQDASLNTIIGGTSASLSGVQNTMIGDTAYAIAAGNSNVCVGLSAGDTITSGSQNTAIGHSALTSSTTTSGSTAIGSACLQSSTGTNNTAAGANAGNTIGAGANNTFLGTDSDGAAISSNQTAIGYQATSDKSNQIMMGNASVIELVPNASATVSLGTETNTFTSAYLEDIAEPTITDTGTGVVFMKTGDDGIWWKPGSGTAVDLTATGSGDVVGPASAVDNNLCSFDTTTGKLIQDSGLLTSNVVDLSTAQTLTNKSIAATQLTGQVAIANGGTGAATAAAGFDALAPTGTRGDIITRGVSSNQAVAIGTNGQVLTSDGTDAAWATPASGFADPMTTRGDVIIRNAANTTARLGIGTASQVLQSDGTDIAWATLASAGDVVGPASAVDNNLCSFDTTTGKLIQDSGLLTSNVVDLTTAQTLTTKTLTAPIVTLMKINDLSSDHTFDIVTPELVADRILNLPLLTGTDTVTCDAHASTLTNKTITSAANTLTIAGSDVSSGQVAVANGGTGAATAAAGFDALAPTTTEGDIIYRNATVNARLAKGTAAQVLTMNAGATAPEWATAAAGFTDPMTTQGDIIIRNTANTTTRLAKGTAAQVLTMNAGATEPEWAAAGGGGGFGDYLYQNATIAGTAAADSTSWTYIDFNEDTSTKFTDSNWTVTNTSGKPKFTYNGSGGTFDCEIVCDVSTPVRLGTDGDIQWIATWLHTLSGNTSTPAANNWSSQVRYSTTYDTNPTKVTMVIKRPVTMATSDFLEPIYVNGSSTTGYATSNFKVNIRQIV